MALEREILEQLQRLPADKQQELLDFAEFLAAKVEKQPASWRPGFFDEVVGGWAGEPLARAPQGEADERDVWP